LSAKSYRARRRQKWVGWGNGHLGRAGGKTIPKNRPPGAGPKGGGGKKEEKRPKEKQPRPGVSAKRIHLRGRKQAWLEGKKKRQKKGDELRRK